VITVRKESDEVLYSEGEICAIGPDDIAELKRLASQTPRRRCRICFHGAPDAKLHEMLIVHENGAWVRPHKHVEKDESLHVVEGAARLVSFSEDGKIDKVVNVGDDGALYCRIPEGVYHTLLIDSDWFVFHETTLGPFERSRTVFAPWAPDDDGDSVALFINELRRNVSTMELKT